MVLSCFVSCFKPQHGRSAAGLKAGPSGVSEDWQSVPDDVLQTMVAYLDPQDVATARLVCRHWRTTLSCYTTTLTLPTSFLGSKAARPALCAASGHFPSVTRVALQHAGGWCDPVQARMDVEPLVQQERRSVSLEPLAAAFGQLQHLSVADASFTRHPWSLDQLAWLPRLCSLSLAWDTGLWAPGQVLQEADALQPVFGLTQLTALSCTKAAHLFLGEVPLGDAVLASAAASLRRLARLSLDAVSISDEGFAALGALTSLTELSLRGQLGVSLGVLGSVFAATTGLQELNLCGLVPCSKDLKRVAAAYSDRHPPDSSTSNGYSSSRRRHSSSHHHRHQHQHQHQASSSGASPSSSLGSSSRAGSLGGSLGGSHGRSHHSSSLQGLQGELQQPGGGGSGSGWRSSKLWQQQEAPKAPSQQPGHAHASSSSSKAQAAPGPHSNHGSSADSTAAGASSAAVRHGSRPTRSSSSSSSSRRGRFRSADWTVVLLALRRLRVLRLQSDLVFLGSCAALRSMGHVTHIELHGAAKFLQHGPHLQPYKALPPSWLTQLSRDASAAAAAAAAAQGGASSSKAGSMLRAGGVWPGLVSLHVDNLQLADGFVQGVAQLANLRTLIVTGPCLLAAAQQQHLLNPGGAAPWQQLQQPSQQPNQQSASAPEQALPGSSLPAALGELPQLSGLSQQQVQLSKPGPTDAWATHKQGPKDPAAALAAALASLRWNSDSSSSSSTTGSITSTSTASVTATANSSSTSSGGSQRSAAPLFTASGMRPQLQLPVAAMLAAMQQEEGTSLFRPVLDADVLTRLSPLSQLSKFELHLQQQLPCGLQMTPFALAHLSVSWTCLTSLSLSVPAPAPLMAAAAGGLDSDDVALALEEGAAHQLFVSLGCLQGLKHLSLSMADAGVCARDSGSALQPSYALGTPLASTPEQPQGGDSFSTTTTSSSSALAIGAAVAALPWHVLPASLESLSLSGFVGITPDNIRALGTAAQKLRHLRLMYCQVPTAVFWSLLRFTPHLHTLVVKEDALGGVGSSSVAAIAGLSHLTSLGVTVEPGTDVGALADVSSLRYLLLDGRSNTHLRGVKGLSQLVRLKTLVLPLLHVHHTNKTLLTTLQLALPHTHIANVSRNFGQHHGCQWFRCFTAAEREWWRVPAQPWAWHPTLDITP